MCGGIHRPWEPTGSVHVLTAVPTFQKALLSWPPACLSRLREESWLPLLSSHCTSIYPHHSSDHTARDSAICVAVSPATPRLHRERKAAYSPPSTQAEPSTVVQVQGTELSSQGAGLPLTACDVLGLFSTLSYCFRYRPFSLCCPWIHREVVLHWSTVNLPGQHS